MTWVLSLVQALAVVTALAVAPWRQIRDVPARLHLLFGSVLFLFLLWRVDVDLGGRLDLHLLGVTAVTLLIGPALGLLAGTVAQAATLLAGGSPATLLADAALNVGVPVLTTWAVLTLVMRHGPRNPYGFMLGAGFFGGALSMLAVILARWALRALAGWGPAAGGFDPELTLLLMYAEGFVNGALVTALTVFAPDLVKTLDDRLFDPPATRH